MTAYEIHGRTVDDETRCVHYSTARDIVAIKFHCCGDYYPCHACHDETAGHAVSVWPQAEFETEAILCGACGDEFSIARYLEVDACPACSAEFNPGCRLHSHLYFEVDRPGRRTAP